METTQPMNEAINEETIGCSERGLSFSFLLIRHIPFISMGMVSEGNRTRPEVQFQKEVRQMVKGGVGCKPVPFAFDAPVASSTLVIGGRDMRGCTQ